MIPSEANYFQHRRAVEDLDAAMAGSGAAIICQVLSGTGGVGKTQLAAHYARRQWSAKELDLLVWVTAGSREAIVSQYARAGQQVAGADDADPVLAAGEFRNWLETTTRRWLVVLDDLANPGDLTGLWPPRHSTGRAIVTTRRRDAALLGMGRRLVAVDLFTMEEASNYLAATLAAQNRRDNPDQILALAKDLGLLPLALAQAAAYVIDRGLKCVEYRQRFADRRRTLAELLPEEGALPDEQRATVAATWSLSVELADQLAPRGLARPMLQLSSVLDPNGIPVTVLTSPPALQYVASHRTSLRLDARIERQPVPVEVSKDTAREALYCLHRLSLADLADEAGERGLRVHGLIQRATRDQLAADQVDEVVQASSQALIHVWAADQTPVDSAILRANVEALRVNAEPQLWSLGSHAVLFQVGRSLGKDGLFAAISPYWQQLRLAAEHHLGPNHADTFLARRYAATTQVATGDLAGGIGALEELFADQQLVQGPDHPDTLATRAALADGRGAAGDRAGAVAAWEELLADRQRIQGPDHPDTLATRAVLANRRAAAGDRAGAVTALEELLAGRQLVQGPDHPDTLATRAVLADHRAAAGDRAGAVAAWEELLADRQRIQGPDHPDTLATRALLADRRGAAGDRAGAIAALEELLADRQRIQGPDHPDTLATRALLANQRGAAGDRAGAVTAWEELLADRQRIQGPDHPDMLATRAALANWRRTAGDRAGAIAALEELLAGRQRTKGPYHPTTLATRVALAEERGQAGDRAGAIAALEELLADRQRIQGPDHPDTLATRAVLANQRGQAGDRAGAIAALEELLADRQRIQGPDHPDMLATRAGLANWRRTAGDRAGAIAALEELLADRQRIQGPDHPDTLATKRSIAYWRKRSIQSTDLYAYEPKSKSMQSSPAAASDDSYIVRWRATDGTEQFMGPFPDADTAEEVGTWVRRGKGTDVEVVKQYGRN